MICKTLQQNNSKSILLECNLLPTKTNKISRNLRVFSHRKYKCVVAPALAYTMRSAYCLLMTRCNYVLSATAHNAYRFVGKQTIHSIELLYKSQTNGTYTHTAFTRGLLASSH